MLTNVPSIRVHTDTEAFPQRLLVIGEFGTFAGMAARIHHRHGGTGPLQL